MALVVLSKVEQRLDAVRAVLGGAKVSEVAGSVGVSRQTLHTWLTRYLLEGVAGLADRSHRPESCPHETPEPVDEDTLSDPPSHDADAENPSLQTADSVQPARNEAEDVQPKRPGKPRSRRGMKKPSVEHMRVADADVQFDSANG